MIILPREIPRILLKIEALMGRLPENHPKLENLTRDYGRIKAGYQGEKSLEYYFSLMNQEKYDFYHGLRLQNSNSDSFFQIDTLIVSDAFVPLVEIKNLSGTVVYDKNTNQFTQNSKPIINPISQVKLQKLQLIDWFQKHKFQPFPVDYLIAMANPSTKIEAPNGNPEQFWKMCYGHDFIDKIQLYEKTHKMQNIPIKERKRLRKLLLKYHTPLEVDVLKKYTISKQDIITGVRCPLCHSIPMMHSYGSWECLFCHHKSKDAHKNAVNDHFFIFGPTITNKEFRELTHIESPQSANRLLTTMNLQHTGSNKGRIYYATWYLPSNNKKE
ncbi:hypothetical protein NEOCIP111885_03473 [Pseudoneobacillus rhizosphaerae]|jgi:hypothetical protein|uniref:NERD domain-containing protein n=1 Tax=Pseudoneobacillus rhizosphaerae TaxID=2880968 RepID=A0A9C7GCM1_9BACI|nr:hypothetical protein NEOCIP111885_03473 [Pseudoneobacillus rhizosphaerae]